MILIASIFLVGYFSTVDCRAPPNYKLLEYPTECAVRQYNFTPTVTDANGKKCRGLISTKGCFGSCESYEYGTHEFPYIVSVTPTCNYDETIEMSTILTNCDQGVDAAAKHYRYIEAVSCVCAECNPKKQKCRTLPVKRGSKEQHPTMVPEGEFGNYVPTNRKKRIQLKPHRRTKAKVANWW